MMRDNTLCFLSRGNPPQEVLLGLKKKGFGLGKYAGFGGGVGAGETVAEAACRELEEEAGIKISGHDLYQVAHLTFLFPAKPTWNQVVHVFLATIWIGSPVESEEMKPAWYAFEDIPFDCMWDDAIYWLPLILRGKKIKAIFAFKDDNETLDKATISEQPVEQ